MGANGPELNFANVVLSALPIVVLIVTMLGLRWSAPRAGAVSWLVAGAVALLFFGSDERLVAIGSSKGLSLSLFVLSIIWTSVLLYNLIDQLGGIEVISSTMTRLVRDPLAQALVVGWAFSGFVQGIAGFGVPVALVAPLLVLMGFHPVKAAAIVLVGHAWAVALGSLGSSYYTILLVTGLPGGVLGGHMAAMMAVPVVLTGLAVAHLEGGMASVRRGFPAVLIIGGVMAGAHWAMAALGAPQIAAIVSGLIGCGAGWLVARALLAGPVEPAAASPRPAPAGPHPAAAPGFHLAFLPYYLLILFSVVSQIPAVKTLGAAWRWGLDYPATESSLGYVVGAQDSYAPISLLSHPAPLILASLSLTYVVFRIAGKWKTRAVIAASRDTYTQSVSTSVAAVTMMMMALVMTDTGMTVLLGQAVAKSAGPAFAIFSPYIGVLGTFMTGSNTSSNVLFGALQLESAKALDIGEVTVTSAQSIGGSLGSAIAPAKVLVGTAMVGLSGHEGTVLRRTIPYCLALVLLVGLEAWVLVNLFSAR